MQATKMGLKSYHTLSKDLPITHEFKCEYVNNATLALNQCYTQALNDDNIVTNNHTETSQEPRTSQHKPTNDRETIFCDGAYVEVKDCLDALMKKVHKVVKKKKNTSVEEAMKGSFLILCTDGAVHPRMQNDNSNIITYSVTLSSPYLVKECGFYPTSGTNILPHVQLRGKENVNTL